MAFNDYNLENVVSNNLHTLKIIVLVKGTGHGLLAPTYDFFKPYHDGFIVTLIALYILGAFG